MTRTSKRQRMEQYDRQCEEVVAIINSKLPTFSHADKTIRTAFGVATMVSIRWQPASIGGTWGRYQMENGSIQGFVVSTSEIANLCKLSGVEWPQFPR